MADIDAWVLSGGEGRRMGGQDKGLVLWQEQPMAWRVATGLAPQVRQVHINANRHLDVYRQWTWPVHADAADLPLLSGPLVGMLTGLRQTSTPWLQLAPCDSPHLPACLVAQLFECAQAQSLDIVVPMSMQGTPAQTWHHWTTALVSRRTLPSLEQAVAQGERRVGVWMQTQRWAALLFDTPHSFSNINSLVDALPR